MYGEMNDAVQQYDAIQVGRVLRVVTSDGQIRSVVYNWKMRIVTYSQIERGANCTLLTFLSVENVKNRTRYYSLYIASE